MAQINLVMQAKAAIDAAWQEVYCACGDQRLMDATNSIRGVLEEEEKRFMWVLLEEEETPATKKSLWEEECIGDWLTSVKNVANTVIASCRRSWYYDVDQERVEISTRLEELARKFEGFRSTKGLPLASSSTEQPSSRVVPLLLGRERDADKRRIIDSITQQSTERWKTQTDEAVILAIFGPAGVGKTTLVKSIFHDPRLFEGYAKTWVHAPEGGDLIKICKSIVSTLQGAESSPVQDDCSSDDMKNRIVRRLEDKKLLLVLDDLWLDEDFYIYRMGDLKGLLRDFGGNLVVLVTTTRKRIADLISSTGVMPYQLHPLSHDTCWAIIKQTSGFEARIAGGNYEEAEAADCRGREIASKCCGLPLAAKAIGRTMRSLDIQGWSTLAEDIWSIGRGYSWDDSQLPHHTLAVFSHLKQAYHMPPKRWLTFATCAFCFSKGRGISRHELYWLWRGLGIGDPDPWPLLDCWLLHQNSASNVKDGMLVLADDITFDFASYILGDRLMVVDGRSNNNAAKRSSSTYLAVIKNWEANQPLDLSSILPAGIQGLRFEDLSVCSLKKLPGSIGKLEQLRYLNAPGIQDRVLPSWLTRLPWLTYLSLRGSPLLSDLTEAFGGLRLLNGLDLSGCTGLKALPDSFKKLHRLIHLDLSGCSGLKALPYSFEMPGKLLDHLDLSGWSCVGGITEALQRSNLGRLQYLNLSHRCTFVEDWFHLTKNLDEVLPLLEALQSLVLSSSLNPLCYTSTPATSTSYVDRCIKDLVKLQHLDLSQNTFLEQLPESIADLKELRSLDLSGCFRLKMLPENIADLKELRSLDLSGCFRLDRLPERICELQELQTLDLSACPQFEPLPEEVKQKLAELRYYGSLTIITDHEEYHLCQVAACEERSIVAGDDQAQPQGGASTSQEAAFVHQPSGKEPEITEADD